VAIVSKASEPQIRADMGEAPEGKGVQG
jgi:hypothetical protein